MDRSPREPRSVTEARNGRKPDGRDRVHSWHHHNHVASDDYDDDDDDDDGGGVDHMMRME